MLFANCKVAVKLGKNKTIFLNVFSSIMANKECILEASVTEGERPDLNSPEGLENVEKFERVLTKLDGEEDENYDETMSQHSRVACKGRFGGQLIVVF